MSDPSTRHHLFETARGRADLTVRQLWLDYVALGGLDDFFDVDAYLQGLGHLAAAQQDVLACALNERLEDFYWSSRVPYVTLGDAMTSGGLPLAVLEQLLSPSRRPPPPQEW